MLAAIRENLAASAPFDAVRDEHRAQHSVETRTINAPVGPCDQTVSPAERFRQALEAVSGHCMIVRDESEAAAAVQRIIEQKKAQSISVSNSTLVERVLQRVKSDAVRQQNAGPRFLFDCDIGITSAQWAIAETGTLVLESEAERHRLTSLLPPVHIAIVETCRIRQTLVEVIQLLGEKGKDSLSRTVTLITGPSRTSDIELTLAIGVHGPAELFVIMLEGEDHG